MVRQVNVVMLQGDHLSFLRDRGLAALGYGEPLTTLENVAGAFVMRTSAELAAQADEHLETLAMTVADGWTILSDPSGFLGWANAASFDPARKLRPWLLTIAHNVKREYWRRKGRRPEEELVLDGRRDNVISSVGVDIVTCRFLFVLSVRVLGLRIRFLFFFFLLLH